MGWLIHRVPLAWKNLTHRKLRLLVAVAGITFAVLLMFVQFGFRAALLDSNTQIAAAAQRRAGNPPPGEIYPVREAAVQPPPHRTGPGR